MNAGFDSARDLESTVDLKTPITLLDPEGAGKRDAENAVRIHQALKNLTRMQARDPRLWTRLAHVELWPYMRKRWEVERHEGDKAVRFVVSRYFVAQIQSRALLRNGIARLWWAAYLSHTPDRPNPYQLTDVLFQYLDITQSILERNLGRSSTITTAFLDFLLANSDPLLKGGDRNRKRIRELAKFLNLHGGVCLLDVLSREQITELLTEEYAQILKNE